MARPTKLSQVVKDRILEALGKGAPMDTAAALAGIEPRTLYQWIARGKATDSRPPTPEYVQFAQDVARVKAEYEEACLATIRAAHTGGEFGGPDWRAQAWLLERTRPEKFGQTVQVRAKVDDELRSALERLRTRLDPETFDRVVDVLATDPASSGTEGEPGDDEGK